MVHPNNPLTARVIVNRIWAWVFGQGLVRSPDDFGATGDSPSHPELLDYLAHSFVENSWSVKGLIRELLVTRTFQLSSAFNPANHQIDPDNRFLWRAHQRRLEAEAIRDAFLAVSGNLDFHRPAVPLLSRVGEGTVGQNVFEPEIRKTQDPVRSIYLPRVRNALPESLELFDAPGASSVAGSRDSTTVPTQALYVMNSPFARDQAEAFAAKLSSRPISQQLDYAHLLALGRMPTPEERTIASQFAQTFRRAERESDPAAVQRKTLIAYCHALLCSAEFSVID